MKIEASQIRGHRLAVHHLHEKMPVEETTKAVGVCGLQNTPPGAWETAMFCRVKCCSISALHDALYNKKTLLQAWSYRGTPVVFPTEESGIFLTPLIAREGEWPWIYTRGITGALDHLNMSFDDVLLRAKKAALYLDDHTIKSKEGLDQTLADIIEADLPKGKRALWRDRSMYGNPARQTVGGAAVSFMLRPCAFHSLVVFGARQGISPTFTSLKNWTGHTPAAMDGAEAKLVRKFLHCYGPATVDYFMNWLGCSKQQAKRLWDSAADEMLPVEVEGKIRYALLTDRESLISAEADNESIVLLGAHDPYLGLGDREVILQSKAYQNTVWKYTANPGVVLKGGRVIGVWRGNTHNDKLDVSISVWETATAVERKTLDRLAQEYAAFRLLGIKSCTIEGA